MKVHKAVPPPPFKPPAEVPFVMHYAPHGPPDESGRVRCLGTRACDGGPMADLGQAAAAIALFQADGMFVAPRWSSANTPDAVTCRACAETAAFKAAVEAWSQPVPVDPGEAGVFGNLGTIVSPTGSEV